MQNSYFFLLPLLVDLSLWSSGGGRGGVKPEIVLFLDKNSRKIGSEYFVEIIIEVFVRGSLQKTASETRGLDLAGTVMGAVFLQTKDHI
jgi:hypothetical protein